jgi:hypothetical protein
MRQSHKKSRSLLLIGLPALLLACGDSTPPHGQSIQVGSYSASQFQTTGSSGQTDQLAAGSTLQINLTADGTTTGHLHLAASGGTPAFDADMAGTWTENANVVTFSQAADTFVRNMPFTAGPDANGKWSLAGNKAFSGTLIQITLSKTS